MTEAELLLQADDTHSGNVDVVVSMVSRETLTTGLDGEGGGGGSWYK